MGWSDLWECGRDSNHTPFLSFFFGLRKKFMANFHKNSLISAGAMSAFCRPTLRESKFREVSDLYMEALESGLD